MKKLLILPGNSLHNQAWGEACGEFFRPDFDRVFMIHYDHWTSGAPNIDFVTELTKIAETVDGGGEEEDEWYIFAKSIGSILAMKAVQQSRIAPKRCVFFGMPLGDKDLSLLSNFTIPTLAYHNDHDPTAPYADAARLLQAAAPAMSLRTLQGNNHDYLDFYLYKTEIGQFLSI